MLQRHLLKHAARSAAVVVVANGEVALCDVPCVRLIDDYLQVLLNFIDPILDRLEHFWGRLTVLLLNFRGSLAKITPKPKSRDDEIGCVSSECSYT